MDTMRAASKSWVAAILIGFLILSFAVWGINDIFTGRSATTLAKAGESELDYRTFESEFMLRTRQQIDASGRPMTIQEARNIGYDKVVLDDMVKDMAVLNEARRLELGVSEAMIRAALAQIPGLANATGQIDPSTFERFLQQIQMTEPQLVQLMRENMMRDQLVRTAMVGGPAPRGMAIALGAYANERRTVEYLVFPADKAPAVSAPDDAALQAYMEANAAAYTTPELRTVTALIIDANEMAAKVAVTDEELATEYEARKATYETIETRELHQIAFPSKDEADAARKSLDEGKSFEEIATARGLSAEDINLGTISKGDTAVPAGAFDIKEGEVTQPLEGPFGWVLVKAAKVTPGSVKPLDEVKDELRQAIALDRALVEISDKTSAIEDALAAADQLESVPSLIGDGLPAKVVTFAPMTARGADADGNAIPGLPDGDAYIGEVFGAEAGDMGQLAETPKHVLYVARVDQITPPELQKVADHRDAVLAAWTAAEQAKGLAALAAGAAERANAQGTAIEALATELGLEARTAEGLARDTASEDLSPALVAELFATPQGTWTSGAATTPPGAVLARVRTVTTAASEDPRAAERDARSDLTSEIANEFATAYQDAILKATPVEIDETLFNQLKTRQQ